MTPPKDIAGPGAMPGPTHLSGSAGRPGEAQGEDALPFATEAPSPADLAFSGKPAIDPIGFTREEAHGRMRLEVTGMSETSPRRAGERLQKPAVRLQPSGRTLANTPN